MGTSTANDTDGSNYIEITSADGVKASDFCTEIRNSSGAHVDSFLLHHYMYTSTSTSNFTINELLSLSQFLIQKRSPHMIIFPIQMFF